MKCRECGEKTSKLYDGICAACMSYGIVKDDVIEEDGGSDLQYISGISDEDLWKEMLDMEKRNRFTSDEEGLCKRIIRSMGLTDREKDMLKETIQLLTAKYYEQLLSKEVKIGLLKNYGRDFGGTMVEKYGAIIVYTDVKY